MTAVEFAKAMDYDYSTIVRWLKLGLVPDAQFMPISESGKYGIWRIPESALQMEKPRLGRKRAKKATKKGAAKKKAPEPKGEIKVLGKGVEYAGLAINQLRVIYRDNPLRARAFQIVHDWLKHQIEPEDIVADDPTLSNAYKAISQLKKIRKGDALKARGFQIVQDWIEHNA